MKRTLQELNLIDNFLFYAAIDHEQYGPILARTILEPVLQRSVRIGKITSEKVILPQKPGLHGIRMDAFIQEDAIDVSQGEVFDLEPERKEYEKMLLPKRSRFIHSKIDSKLLQSGKTYASLPGSWVIFITSFDPFGENRMVYTIRRTCIELPEMDYNDGAVTLFLYVNGDQEDASDELAALLHYMGNTIPKNACSPKLKELQTCIEDLKQDPEVKEAYMTFEELLEAERWEVRREVEEETKHITEEANRKAEEANRKAEEANRKAEEAKRKTEEANRRVEEANRRTEKLQAERNAAVSENARLKDEIARLRAESESIRR